MTRAMAKRNLPGAPGTKEMANGMTLAQAEFIANQVTSVFAHKPHNSLLPQSKLRGYSITTVRQSFALIVAGRRQMWGNSPDDIVLKEECKKFADSAEALIFAIPQVVVPDDYAEKISKVTFESEAYNHLLRQLIRERNEPKSEWHKLLQEVQRESLWDFNSFCWSLDHRDALFWQKVYTRIGLPYDEDSPVGEPQFISSNVGFREDSYFRGCWGHYKFRTAREQRQQRLFQWGLLIVASLFAAWFI